MTIKPGAFRFNTDSMKLEIFRGSANYEGTASMAGIGTLAAGQWEEIVGFDDFNKSRGGRGLIGGGYVTSPSAHTNGIHFITISSTGDSVNFGDLINPTFMPGAFSSSTRGVYINGQNAPLNYDTIQYVTIASTGDAVDFGDSLAAGRGDSSTSNSTRGVKLCSAQSPAHTNAIDYVTISTLGNAAEFGDLSQTDASQTAAFSNAVRGIRAGGGTSNIVEYITYSTLGNVTDFGDMNFVLDGCRGCANSTRGLVGGGYHPDTPYHNDVEYVQIMTLGNAMDFGDLTTGSRYASALASRVKAIFMIGDDGSVQSTINEFNIASTGDASTFGDMSAGSGYGSAACSDAHGGV